MNCGVYMRKLQAGRTQIIASQSGQDASQVTRKNQARAQGVNLAGSVPTSFSKIDGPVSITERNKQGPSAACDGGYQGVVNGVKNMNTSVGRVVGDKEHCAVCSDAPSSEPYKIVLSCKVFIDPISYNPDATTIDPSQPTPARSLRQSPALRATTWGFCTRIKRSLWQMRSVASTCANSMGFLTSFLD